MADSKAGSFNAYLEYAQRGSTEGTVPAPSGPGLLLGILSKLPGGQASMGIGQLAALSGMSATMFHDALKKLTDLEFVEISGQPLPETITLTAKGRDAATVL
jgi:hypothetical protein